MPWSSASRGEPKVTGLPSTFNVPSVCGCSPEMILIRVDLPAPLSPRTQATSPAFTVQVDALQGDDGAEGLADVLHLDQRFAGVEGGVGVLGERVGHVISPIVGHRGVHAGQRRVEA